ncbi:MAG: ATP-binding protein [Bacteroidales bacterium]|nr:ATP-binding protein [Bacteroidales bacterium]
MPTDEVAKLIAISYKSIVEERGRKFINSTALQENIKKTAKWLTESSKNFLFLAGTVGNGKTTLVKAMIRFFNAYITAEHKDNYYREFFTSTDETELCYLARSDEARFQELKKVRKLFIDDAGTEKLSSVKNFGNEISPFTEVLSWRYEKNYPTIITSNLTLEQIQEHYGMRIYDRICEFNKIIFNEKSYRQI